MSYFDNFPNILYSIDGFNQKAVVDIMRSAKIADYIKENNRSFLDYRVLDGERPEMLAHKAYDKTNYHWIPLLFNEIQDPYYDWPLSRIDLENLITRNYSGMAFFLDVSLAKIHSGEAFVDANKPFNVSIPHFEVGSKIERVVTYVDPVTSKVTVSKSENSPVGEIVEWNPTFMRLKVKPISGIWGLVGEAELARNQGRPVIIGNLSYDIRVVNSRGQHVVCPLVRIVDDFKYSIHHFESQYGNDLSPLTNIVNPLTTPGANDRINTIIYAYVMNGQEVFDLTESLPTEGQVSIVTNQAHEETKNDEKRNIRMMMPDGIQTVIKQLPRIIAFSR